MDYKELSKRMRKRYLDNLNGLLQKPDDVFSDCNKAATAITDLLARAEAAEARTEKAERERDAAVALAHEWEQYGRYLSPMGFTVPPNWKGD